MFADHSTLLCYIPHTLSHRGPLPMLFLVSFSGGKIQAAGSCPVITLFGCVFSLVYLYAVPAKIYLLLRSHRPHNHFNNICQILLHAFFTKQFLFSFTQFIPACLPLNFRVSPGEGNAKFTHKHQMNVLKLLKRSRHRDTFFFISHLENSNLNADH